MHHPPPAWSRLSCRKVRTTLVTYLTCAFKALLHLPCIAQGSQHLERVMSTGAMLLKHRTLDFRHVLCGVAQDVHHHHKGVNNPPESCKGWLTTMLNSCAKCMSIRECHPG